MPSSRSAMPSAALPISFRAADDLIAGERNAAPFLEASGTADHERVLVERAIAGDREAFGRLYERTVDDVYSYVRLRVRDSGLAEDLTQDVYLRAFRALDTFEWRGSILPWLVRIAHNRIANHWRSVGRAPSLLPLPNEDPSHPQPEIADPKAVAEMELTLLPRDFALHVERLTDLQRQVIALRFGAGLSLAETADLMGRTTNAVKNLQHNALAALRRRLGIGAGDAASAVSDGGGGGR